VLRLYIAGQSPSSRRAERNLELLTRQLKKHGHEVEIVDVLQRPDLADQARILATPTLSYEDPVRPRRIIGDLSDTKRVLEFLGLQTNGEDA
jgi:circadian clock protein KaiB